MNSLIVLNAGLGTPSTTRMLAERIAGAVQSQVGRRGESVSVEHVDIREYANDLATLMTTGMPSEQLKEVQDKITAADAMIAVTPVFAASFSGLFKMFMDSLNPDAINGMPVIIAATAGTPRHSLVLEYAMRPLFAYLRADVMPTAIFAATDDFGGEEGLGRRIERAANQLADELARVSGSVAGLGPSFGEATGDNSDQDADAAGDSGSPQARGGQSHPKRSSGTNVSSDVPDFLNLLSGHDGN